MFLFRFLPRRKYWCSCASFASRQRTYVHVPTDEMLEILLKIFAHELRLCVLISSGALVDTIFFSLRPDKEYGDATFYTRLLLLGPRLVEEFGGV